MNTETKPIKLAAICIDGGTQTRAALNEDAVDDYAEAMHNGAKFPPIVVFNDGSAMWLADGFHRCHASKKAGLLDIIAEVHKGTRRNAVKFAIQANQTGSVRRTNADKRKCVEIALAEFPDLSDRALAELCGIHQTTVGNVRKQVSKIDTSTFTPETPKTRKGKDGKEYPAPEPKPEPTPEPMPEFQPEEPEPYPVYVPPLSQESVAAGEEAARDSEKLWLLKSTWRKATKKDRATFLKWAQNNQK
jgi:hypothetical protein